MVGFKTARSSSTCAMQAKTCATMICPDFCSTQNRCQLTLWSTQWTPASKTPNSHLAWSFWVPTNWLVWTTNALWMTNTLRPRSSFGTSRSTTIKVSLTITFNGGQYFITGSPKTWRTPPLPDSILWDRYILVGLFWINLI